MSMTMFVSMHACMHAYAYVMDGWMDGWMHLWMDRWANVNIADNDTCVTDEQNHNCCTQQYGPLKNLGLHR